MSIKNNLKRLVLAASIAASLVSAPSFAAEGDKSTIKGMITAVTGDAVTIKDANNVEQTFTLSPTTKVKSHTGLEVAFKTVESSALIPACRLPPMSSPLARRSTATSVDFKASDFKTAQQVHAGLTRPRLKSTPTPRV